MATERDLTTDLLYWNSGSGVPDIEIMIGVGFEIGGAYEDWGFGIYKVTYDAEKQAYQKKLLSSGRSLKQAIERYREQQKR